jgi:ankyrin repeat protein
MQTFTATRARDMIPDYTKEKLTSLFEGVTKQKISSLLENMIWINYLCARGDVLGVKKFLDSKKKEELKVILNKKLSSIFNETVLHTVLYWNSGQSAMELFSMLLENGALISANTNGELPWQVKSDTWISPFGTKFGIRDNSEFEHTNCYIAEIAEKFNKQL